MRTRGAVAVLAWAAVFSPTLASAGRATRLSELPRGQRPLLIVMNEVVDGLVPRILAGPSETGRRVTVRDGLAGLGPYEPRGGSDGGIKAPPRDLFPRPGLGNSLNVDPITGRSYLANTP